MYSLVADEKALTDLIDRLGATDWIALDTEFVRERTYWPNFCLLQVADRDGLIACVDPLALPSLDPLFDVIWREGITKVMHAASQDLEVLCRLRGPMPGPVFDTQVAAALVGDDEQIGYAAAVEAHLGIKLEKAHTRTDWSRRPLSGPELEYAADDVRHLPALYDSLQAALEEHGRRDWALEESAALADPARYGPDPDNAWRRVKKVRDLDAHGLAVLRGLAAWRERTAVASDRPRRWILGDEQLVALAQRQPTDAAGLAAIDGMPPAVLRKHGDSLLAAIADARADPETDVRTAPLDRAERTRVDAMLKQVRARAAELSIAPSMLATRRDCEAVVRGETPPSLTTGWRRAVIGDDLMGMA